MQTIQPALQSRDIPRDLWLARNATHFGQLNPVPSESRSAQVLPKPDRRPALRPDTNLLKIYFGLRDGSPKVGADYGATYTHGVTNYLLWAPLAQRAELLVLSPPKPGETRHVSETLEERIMGDPIPMTLNARGDFEYQATNNAHPPGTLYMYRIYNFNGSDILIRPDPRSKFQPEDIYGPSQIVDLDAYTWQSPKDWWKQNEFLKEYQNDPMLRRMVSYRLHVGTFTEQGTFESTIEKLKWIKNRGFNAVDIMPIMEFPGRRGWSYDQVQHFALENAYGRWENFQRLVDECHKLGLAVIMDVCYNHLGPVGNYHNNFDPNFANGHAPCGDRFNWDRGGTDLVLKNLEMWVKKARIDGFRFDMTPHFDNDEVLGTINQNLRELSREESRPIVQKGLPARPLFSIAEDYRGEYPALVTQYGFNRVYDFDFHHLTEDLTRGDRQKIHDLYQLLDKRNPYSHHHYYRYRSGHDEIANPHGDDKSWAGHRARTKFSNMGLPHAFDRNVLGSLLKYFVPGTPRNFMGEEYGETALFTFFADKSLCNEGDQNTWNIIGRHDPIDPFSVDAFNASKLTWNVNPRLLQLTEEAVTLRKSIPALWQGDQEDYYIYTGDLNEGILAMKRWGVEDPEDEVFIVMNFSDNEYHDKVWFPQGNGQALRAYAQTGLTPERVDIARMAHEEDATWVEIYNSDDKRFNLGGEPDHERGWGRVNGKKHSGKTGMKLAPWSISVFRREQPQASPEVSLHEASWRALKDRAEVVDA